MLNFDEIEVSTKYGSEVREEVVARGREVRKRFIIRFEWSVGVRRPEEEATLRHTRNSVESWVVGRTVDSAKAKEGLNVTNVVNIVTHSHTRDGGLERVVSNVGSGARQVNHGAIMQQRGGRKARTRVGTSSIERRENCTRSTRTKACSKRDLRVRDGGISKKCILESEWLTCIRKFDGGAI